MKKFLITLLLFLFTLPVFAKNTILIVGDSISAGYGIDLSQGWVKLLEKRLKEKKYDYRVINASISGDTTRDGLDRLPTALTQYHPQITLIELGGNDGLRGLQLSVVKNNLQNMIAMVKKAKSKVLILGLRLPPNYGVTYTQQFQQLFLELAKSNHVELVPLLLKNIDDNPKLIQADGIHPVLEAQEKLLNNVWPSLEKILK